MQVLEKSRDIVETMTAALLDQETLDDAEVADLIARRPLAAPAPVAPAPLPLAARTVARAHVD